MNTRNKPRKSATFITMAWRAVARSEPNRRGAVGGVLLATSSIVILLNLQLAIVTRAQEYGAGSASSPKLSLRQVGGEARAEAGPVEPGARSEARSEKAAFVAELLTVLHEQYGRNESSSRPQEWPSGDVMQERRSVGAGRQPAGAGMMAQLLEAIGAEGDARRLLDWIKDSFSPSSIPEVSTQFVVSKLGALNCPALLRPDPEESLIPRFLLFNEHHADVPFELPLRPSSADCLAGAKFDPARKTLILVHGYLGGYTLIDGLTNIKNRLLDLNRLVEEEALAVFLRASQSANASYVFTDDLQATLGAQLYNVIIVDWFNGANPRPRANYVRAAVNAQVVGKLIARFLTALVLECGARADRLQIIAHSLGCHVSGFTGKAMRAAGHPLGKITHLDPVGLCFGRLFSQAHLRLSPSDALDTQAVHVSLNIFDNPLDGAHTNFLLNGGRDQPGCGHQNEVKNSTSSSVSLLWEPAARFAPCSHLRALALFEDEHSSAPAECQFVGYRCANYDRFLAGKCGFCDATNSQCRLMGLAPVSLKLRTMALEALHYEAEGERERQSEPLVEPLSKHFATYSWRDLYTTGSHHDNQHDHHQIARLNSSSTPDGRHKSPLAAPTPPDSTQNSPTTTTRRPSRPPTLLPSGSQAPALSRSTVMYGQPAYFVGANQLSRRSERHLLGEKRERISQALEKLRSDTRLAWTSLSRQTEAPPAEHAPEAEAEAEACHLGAHESAGELQDKRLEANRQHQQQAEAANRPGSSVTAMLNDTPTATTSGTNKPALVQAAPAQPEPAKRFHEEPVEQTPLGGQPIPADSVNGPLFFLGTGSMSPFCVNYYQVRLLIAESRLLRIRAQKGLASNRLKAQYSGAGSILQAAVNLPQREAQSAGRDMLHLTVKLTDSLGHFFRGFSILESARSLARVMNDFIGPASLAPASGPQAAPALNEPMLELTMLLNSTRAQPTKVAEAVISYYFHTIVLADRLEINFMSNISPDIRARYSSVLCPVAINDRHQLVKYIECQKISRRRRRRKR